jgi:hypothetical protein
MTPAGGTTTAATPLQPQPMRRDRKGGRLYLPDPHDASTSSRRSGSIGS